MLRGNRFRLVTLGRLTLVGDDGEEEASLAKRRFKLAILAVLAMARRPMSRDALLEMFWGDDDEGRARHSLSNALSSLRGVLGQSSITTRDSNVGLASELPLDMDALEFAEAVETRDYARAVDLYGGPFLDGVRVEGSPSFDQWVFRERRRLEALFLKAAAQQCTVLARGRRWSDCGALAARWVDTDPLSADAALFLLNAAKAPGSRSALVVALQEYERLRQRLAREFDLAPNKAVVELAQRVRDELATMETAEARVPVLDPVPVGRAPVDEPALPPPASIAEPTPVRRTWRDLRHRTVLGALALAAVAVVVTLGVVNRTASTGAAGASSTPVIAVFSMDLRTDDSTLGWLADGLPLMIDGKLARIEGVDVVPAEQIRSLMLRSGRSGREPIPDDVARDLARRVGATHLARGALDRDGGNVVLELTVHDVSSGSLVRNAVLTSANAIAIADEAAARIVAAANVAAPGVRLAELETSSLEAYQHLMRALDAARAGQRSEAMREYDAAIALDSGFITVLRERLQYAVSDQDTALVARLRSVMQRHAHRATEFDRLLQEATDAFYSGEHQRSEALARALVRRYPRDPRAHSLLQGILVNHGRFEEAERVGQQGLALDTLAMSAGHGPCAPCVGMSHLVTMRGIRRDLPGAAEWARRWIRQQPDAATAWSALAWTYSYMQHPDSALQFMQRAVSLSGGDLWARQEHARMLIIARRYAQADSAIRVVEALAPVAPWHLAADLRSLLERERGRLRESVRVMTRYMEAVPRDAGFADMVRADNLRLLGSGGEAARRYETLVHGPENQSFATPYPPVAARAICWHHALAADALGESADTAVLRAIADSLEAGCRPSYYGRDWILHHHVRGLIAMRAGRYAEAVSEFQRAFWSPVEGWSRTTIELAKAQGASGRPRDAIATLRTGYATRLDAMGRYAPISEFDSWMARMFAQAGEPDSARVYAGYVREAWKDADPEVRRLLDQLPR